MLTMRLFSNFIILGLLSDVFANANIITARQEHSSHGGGEGGGESHHGGHHHHGSPPIFFGYLIILIFGIISLGIAAVTHAGLTHKSATYNRFTRWALYNPTIRFKLRKSESHHHFINFPSYAHMIGAFVLCIFPIMLVLTGPNTPAEGHTRTTSQVNMEVSSKAFDRTGVMAFVLTPLVMVLGLKLPPFAIFAFKWFTNLHFDKVVLFHFTTGVAIWCFSFAHTVLWIKQAWPHRDETGVWNMIWSNKMNSTGFMALLFLSLILLLSIPPIRARFYSLFHLVHMALVFAFLIAAGLHYKPLAPFIWSSLAIWLAERVWRGLRVLWINSGAGRFQTLPKKSKNNPWPSLMRPATTIRSLVSPHLDKPSNLALAGWEEYEKKRSTNGLVTSEYNKSSSNEDVEKILPPFVKHQNSPWYDPPSSTGSFPIRRSHPTGFLHAQLLPGKSVRLTLKLSQPLKWDPGQHCSIIIPEISRFGAHPFTIANVCEDDPCKLVFIVRAKNGWTRVLWEKVRLMRQPKFLSEKDPLDSAHYLPCAAPPVYIRGLIDGPFGSVGRVKWSNYSSILLVCGGSGISFGVSILQHVCNIISLGAGPLRRVRLVWIVKEYAHVQWVASALRRCITILPNDAFQLEIFVSSTEKYEDDKNQPPTISSFFPSPNSPFPPTPALSTGRQTHIHKPQPQVTIQSSLEPSHSPVQRFYTPQDNVRQTDDMVMSQSNATMHTAQASLSPNPNRNQPTPFKSAPQSPEASSSEKSLPAIIKSPPSLEEQSEFDTAVDKDDIEDINKQSSVNDLIFFDGEDDGPAPPVERELSTLISQEGELARYRSNMGQPTPSQMMRPTTSMNERSKSQYQNTPNITFAESPIVPHNHNRNFQQSNNNNTLSTVPTPTPTLKMPDPDNIVLDAIEEGDLFSIAEYARNGKPKFDQIFTQEQDFVGQEALLVATCGPEALNITMKNLVSKSNSRTVAFEESFSW